MWLLVIDAYSKWPEIYCMESTTAETTIKHLGQIFALPRQIISDNGPQFVSTTFQKFCEAQGNQHTKTAPYSPRSNGKAERLVQTFKNAIDKIDPQTNSETQEALVDFLAKRRLIPHTATSQTPSDMFNNHRMSTILDLLHPCNSEAAKLQQHQKAGNLVWARNFREVKRWLSRNITKQNGNVMFELFIKDLNSTWR